MPYFSKPTRLTASPDSYLLLLRRRSHLPTPQPIASTLATCTAINTFKTTCANPTAAGGAYFVLGEFGMGESADVRGAAAVAVLDHDAVRIGRTGVSGVYFSGAGTNTGGLNIFNFSKL
ncbi:hypothetical protein ACJ73_06515 [Blastomyces percursus]|uniref:Uncharacterized protein n=1 Tax=Blastomyces percursus TaxID=1658174 RepID=A0A1J9Q0K0_9EURO|nr:hypothetical protein ACJ73_06515 [Blastomyces percursus]